jgi:hypothetical protein
MTGTEVSPLAWLDEAHQQRRQSGLRRALHPRPADGCQVDLASNDYLGLAQHPEVIDAGVRALRTWGAGSTGSRLVTGNTELHEEFEQSLADRLAGRPIDIEVRMQRGSILRRTLLVFGLAVGAALLLLAAIVWWVKKKGHAAAPAA